MIAVGGSWGTLTEIGFAMRLGRPCVVLEGGLAVDGVRRVPTPQAAVAAVLAALAAHGSGQARSSSSRPA